MKHVPKKTKFKLVVFPLGEVWTQKYGTNHGCFPKQNPACPWPGALKDQGPAELIGPGQSQRTPFEPIIQRMLQDVSPVSTSD